MASYTITNGLSSFYPTKHYGGHVNGNTFTFCEDSDLQSPSANVLAIPNTPVTVLTSSPVVILNTFFGITISNRGNDTFDSFKFAAVRTHDMTGGYGRWKFMEPSDGNFDFGVMDTFVNTHYAAGKDIVFTLFGTPQWASARDQEIGAYGPGNPGLQAEPSDMTKWTRFCSTVAARYLGKIRYYEVWNEPNLFNNGTGATPGTNFFFSGTFAKMAEMVRLANQAIKAVDPTAKIISPSITSWSSSNQAGDNTKAEGYFTSLMGTSDGIGGTTKDWVDIIAVHLYCASSVSNLAGIIDRINVAKTTAGVSAKDTWDTESTMIGPNASAVDDVELIRYLTRHIVTCAAKGIKRSFYYTLDSTTQGFLGRTNIYAYYNNLKEALLKGKILSASKLADGRLAYFTSAGLTII